MIFLLRVLVALSVITKVYGELKMVNLNNSFVFVRHASTDWSPELLDQGPQDLGINKAGEEEVNKASQVLSELVGDKASQYVIVSSDLKRAKNTAEIISRKLSIPIIYITALQERYFGNFKLEKAVHQTTHQLLPIDAESEEVFQERVMKAFSEIDHIDSLKGKKLVIVSHGEVLKCLSKKLTGNEFCAPRGSVCLFLLTEGSQSWSVSILK